MGDPLLRQLVLVASFLPLGSQGTEPPTVAVAVARLKAFAAEFDATLPSLQCDEDMVSQEIKKGKVKKEVRAQAEFRVTRASEVGGFHEDQKFKTLDGKKYQDDGRPPFPLFVFGAFSHGPSTFFYGGVDRCLDFAWEGAMDGQTLTLKVTTKENSVEGLCKAQSRVEGRIVVDRTTLQMLHLERTIADEVAQEKHGVPFAAIDYGPVTLGDEKLWLPIHMASRGPGDMKRFEVNYSNFRRYAGSMRILPMTGPAQQP